MSQLPSRCPACGEKAMSPARLDFYRTEAEHDGRRYQVEVPDLDVLRCSSCGEIALDENADRRVTEATYEAIGLLKPGDIRQGREKIGLKAKDMAAALDVSPSTMSRWENGVQMQQRVMDRFLRAFFALPALRQFLIQGGVATAQVAEEVNPPLEGGKSLPVPIASTSFEKN